MATGIDDEVTLRANREGFAAFQLRPRRLVDVSSIDMRWSCSARPTTARLSLRRPAATRPSTPMARSRSQRRRAPEPPADAVDRGDDLDRGCYRGARCAALVPALSHQRVAVAEAMAKRAEKAGAPAIVVTVDVLAGQNWEMFRACGAPTSGRGAGCHGLGLQSFVEAQAQFRRARSRHRPAPAPPT